MSLYTRALYRAAAAKKVRAAVHGIKAAKFAKAAKANALKTKVLAKAAQVHAYKAALGRP